MPSISPGSRFTMRRLRAGIRSNLLFRFTTTIAVIGEPLEKIHYQALRARTSKNPIIREDDVPALLAGQSSIAQDVHCAELVIDNAIGAASFYLLLTTEIGTSRQSQSRKYSAGAAGVPFLPEGG